MVERCALNSREGFETVFVEISYNTGTYDDAFDVKYMKYRIRKHVYYKLNTWRNITFYISSSIFLLSFYRPFNNYER